MNLETLKRGLDLNKNITDKGGNFEYYIAKVGHLKKNIAIGKYSIFTEAVGNYKEVAKITYDNEIEFLNEDTKEAQWFEGLARTIADRYEGEENLEENKEENKEESKEEKKETKKTAQDILLAMREKREKAAAEEATSEKTSTEKASSSQSSQEKGGDTKKNTSKDKDDFKEKLARIKDDIAKNKKEAKLDSNLKTNTETKTETKEEIKNLSTKTIEDLNKNYSIENLDTKDYKEKKSKDIQNNKKELKQSTPTIELFKKYLKQGTKAGFPASKKLFSSIGFVLHSEINLFKKLFLSTLLLAGSTVIFFISLFFLPTNLLDKVNKKLINTIKNKIKKDKNEKNSSKILKFLLIKLPITLVVLSLYLLIILCIFLLFIILRTISFSIISIALITIIAIILLFGYLFYEEDISHIFHEEFDLKKYEDLKLQKNEERVKGIDKNILKSKQKNEEEVKETEREKVFKSLNKEEKRQFNIIETFIASENESEIKSEKAIRKKIEKISMNQDIEGLITKELLISINRKLIMENKEITNHQELKEALKNTKITNLFI